MAATLGARVLVNEVYRGFGDSRSYHGEAENLVVVSSLSKLFGAYWARVGRLSASEPIARLLRVARLNVSAPSGPNAAVGLLLLEQASQRGQWARERMQDGLLKVDQMVRETGLSWHPPDSAGFGCIRLPEDADDEAFAEGLLREGNALVVPGSMFRLPGTVRLSWVHAGPRLSEGLSAFCRQVSKVRQTVP